jgi:hypothetical protein
MGSIFAQQYDRVVYSFQCLARANRRGIERERGGTISAHDEPEN